MNHTFETMGTVVSLDIPVRLDSEQLANEVQHIFNKYDGLYSPYKSESLVTLANKGKILHDQEVQLGSIRNYTDFYSMITQGWFEATTPDGDYDPSGVVKALAIKEAGEFLGEYGAQEWCLNAGGDILVSGNNNGQEWLSGVADPENLGELLTVVGLSPLHAIATSGTSERGEHIWISNLKEKPNRRPIQATVMSEDIVLADVLATTFIAAGEEALLLSVEKPYEALIMFEDGTMTATPGFRANIR